MTISQNEYDSLKNQYRLYKDYESMTDEEKIIFDEKLDVVMDELYDVDQDSPESEDVDSDDVGGESSDKQHFSLEKIESIKEEYRIEKGYYDMSSDEQETFDCRLDRSINELYVVDENAEYENGDNTESFDKSDNVDSDEYEKTDMKHI